MRTENLRVETSLLAADDSPGGDFLRLTSKPGRKSDSGGKSAHLFVPRGYLNMLRQVRGGVGPKVTYCPVFRVTEARPRTSGRDVGVGGTGRRSDPPPGDRRLMVSGDSDPRGRPRCSWGFAAEVRTAATCLRCALGGTHTLRGWGCWASTRLSDPPWRTPMSRQALRLGSPLFRSAGGCAVGTAGVMGTPWLAGKARSCWGAEVGLSMVWISMWWA